MTITARDRKVLLLLVPIALLLVYWFALLGPKRSEASKAGEELTKQEQKRDEAVSTADELERVKGNFRDQYATVVRLGKAVPSSLDMPSLLVQLNAAARGTRLRFNKITVGERASAGAATGAAAGGATPPSSGSSGGQTVPPVAAGGSSAQSAPGQQAEKANDAAAGANASNAQRRQDPTNTQTSVNARPGGLPVGGGSASKTVPPGGAGSAPGGAGSGVAGLDSVPLELDFTGGYFDLASFFHRLKRFVQVTNAGVRVHGRLLTIDGLTFKGGSKLVATVNATIYLVPEQQGVAAGASPAGPSPTPASSAGSGASPSSSNSAPTAAVTP